MYTNKKRKKDGNEEGAIRRSRNGVSWRWH